MSIIRVGLAETKNFSDGYDLIFGKKEEKKPTEENQDPKQDDTTKNKTEKK